MWKKMDVEAMKEIFPSSVERYAVVHANYLESDNLKIYKEQVDLKTYKNVEINKKY